MPSSSHHDAATGDWSSLHDLGLIYLALTHGADAELDPSEAESMARRLRTWVPEANTEVVRKVLHEVMLAYMGAHAEQMLEASMASVREDLPKPKRIALLNDLAEIAAADGMVVPGEVQFIQHLAHYWEVDRDIRGS